MKSFKLLLLHCIPATAVPIILAATAVAGTGLAVAQTVMTANQKLPSFPGMPGSEEKSAEEKQSETHERSTLRERRQKRTQNIFTSPLGAPLRSSIKSLLGS